MSTRILKYPSKPRLDSYAAVGGTKDGRLVVVDLQRYREERDGPYFKRVLRDADGKPSGETVRIDLSRPRVRVRYEQTGGTAA